MLVMSGDLTDGWWATSPLLVDCIPVVGRLYQSCIPILLAPISTTVGEVITVRGFKMFQVVLSTSCNASASVCVSAH